MNAVPLGSVKADGGVRTTAPRNVAPVTDVVPFENEVGRVGLYAAVSAAEVR